MNKKNNINVINENILGAKMEITYINDELSSFKHFTSKGIEQIYIKKDNSWDICDKDLKRIGYITENNIYTVKDNGIVHTYTMNEQEYEGFKFIIFLIEKAIFHQELVRIKIEISTLEEEVTFLRKEMQELGEELKKNILSNELLMEIINRGDKISLNSIKLYLKYISKKYGKQYDQESIDLYFKNSRKCDIKKVKKLVDKYKDKLC